MKDLKAVLRSSLIAVMALASLPVYAGDVCSSFREDFKNKFYEKAHVADLHRINETVLSKVSRLEMQILREAADTDPHWASEKMESAHEKFYAIGRDAFEQVGTTIGRFNDYKRNDGYQDGMEFLRLQREEPGKHRVSVIMLFPNLVTGVRYVARDQVAALGFPQAANVVVSVPASFDVGFGEGNIQVSVDDELIDLNAHADALCKKKFSLVTNTLSVASDLGKHIVATLNPILPAALKVSNMSHEDVKQAQIIEGVEAEEPAQSNKSRAVR